MHQEIVIDNFFTIDQALKFHSGYYGVRDDPAWRQKLIERLGLGPHLHKIMIKLSGGLKRRFMIAKALIHKPRLLILDEPTAGVDVELRHGLWEFVREINEQGTTILLTTHYLEEAEQMCGRLAHHESRRAGRPGVDGRRCCGGSANRQTVGPAPRPCRLPAAGAGSLSRAARRGRPDAWRSLCRTAAGPETSCELLCRCGLAVDEIETRRAGLEEVFLKLTGLNRTERERRLMRRAPLRRAGCPSSPCCRRRCGASAGRLPDPDHADHHRLPLPVRLRRHPGGADQHPARASAMPSSSFPG